MACGREAFAACVGTLDLEAFFFKAVFQNVRDGFFVFYDQDFSIFHLFFLVFSFPF